MSNPISPLLGYPRPDGRWGFRNHILILPLHQALSTAARDIADATPGAVAISHDWSGEIDNDFERITKTFAGFAGNPNIYKTQYTFDILKVKVKLYKQQVYILT